MARGKYCKICGLYDDAGELTDKNCTTCAMPLSKDSPPIVLVLGGKSKFFCCKKCVKLFLAR
jgi:hypothetical protein